MAHTTTKTIYGVSPLVPVEQELVGSFISKRGFGFPVGKKTSSGHPFFFVETGETLIKNNLKQLLNTEPGERVLLPDFGCGLRKFLFQPLDSNTKEQIKDQIITSITKYLPSVLIEEINVEEVAEVGPNNNQVVNIGLRLRVKDETNLVFYAGVKIK
jgi:phage baseplate assembly protein W